MKTKQFIGWLLGLENVQSINGVEHSFAAPWAHHYPALVFFGCVLLALLAVAFYVKFQPGTRPKARLALGVCRAALLCLLLVILADPILTVRLTSNPKPLLWVLFDGSDSMSIQDEMPDAERARLAQSIGAVTPGDASTPSTAPAKLTRAEYVRAWVTKKDNNVLARLSEKFRLRGYLFENADGVRTLDWNTNASEAIDAALVNTNLTSTGPVTALGRAFEDLSLRHATSNVAGVIVVSDFDQNAGPPPVAKAQSLGVPVYAIGVGPKAAIDLGLDLQSPPLMKKAERSTVTVTLRQSGLEGSSVDVSVVARRMGNPDEVTSAAFQVGQRSVELLGPTIPLEFAFTPEETGRFEFIAEATPLPGEVVDQNNRSSREVNIRDDFLRLMFVEYEPTWEWRFIKEVFHRDKLVGMRGFRTFLRSSDPRVRKSNELFLPTITPQRSEFFANDVIFLGDMPSDSLSPRFCEMVKEYVSKFGGGLVVIAGPRFGPGHLADTPLADMLPVVVDPDARLADQRPFHPRLTSLASQYEFMNLGQDEAENHKAWENLGQLPWYQPVARVRKDVSTVLAEHPTDTCIDGQTPQPLVAIRRYGRGEVVYLGFNETWRLRRKYGEQYYRQFWGQMIHRLGLSHALGSQKRFVVRTDRQRYQGDDRVILTAEAYDANFEPLSDEKLADRSLSAELIVPPRRGESFEPRPLSVPQLREGVFEAQIPVSDGGEYRIRVKDPVTEEFSEVNFQVTSLSAERRSAVRNVQLQEEITQATGGKSYDLETASRLPEEIAAKPLTETSIKVFSLWDTWLSFALIVGLMLSEWLVRKLIHLP